MHLAHSAGSAPAGRAPSEAPPWLAAWHFFKHSDARRQDGVLVAKSLAYQCATLRPRPPSLQRVAPAERACCAVLCCDGA